MSNRVLPEYSVLMSVYKNDKPEFLDCAIESMVFQSVRPRDIVLVCDGPLSSELEACLEGCQNRLGDELSLIRLSKNHGLGYALNVGLPRCACNVVARMDSDDVSRPDRCEKLLNKMTDDGLDLVGGAIEEFDRKPGDMGVVRKPPQTQEEINTWLKRRNPFNHVSVMFDRHMVEEAGGYEPFPWLEDYWLWARMIAHGCRCANISDVVVDVRTGEGMYARRSSMAYLKSQTRLFSELRNLGLVNNAERTKAVALRTIATLLPAGLAKYVYNTFLRSKVGALDE